MRQLRGRRKKPRSLHLSISATDEEWEIVRRNSARRRKSIARYLVGLALEEDSTAMDSTGPEVALDPCGAARGAGYFCGESTSMSGMRKAVRWSLIFRRVFAVIFDGWAKGMVAGGRSRELRDTLVHVVGEEYADTLMASLGPAELKPEQ